MPGIEENSFAKSATWSSIGEEAIERLDKREQNLKKKRCYRKHEYSDLDSYKEIVNSGRIRYKSFEDAMRFYFDNCSFRLGYMQKKLFEVLIVCVLKKIFQEDLISNLKFLSKKFVIDELNDAAAILFPNMSLLHNSSHSSCLFIVLYVHT
jgi:hypothetical protein